jgi:uncharacterized protein (TIGR02646 family)
MIPVAPAPEPPTFDERVRRRGAVWLAKKGLAGATAAPAGTEIEPYWRDCLPDLMDAYDHVCAYASLRIHSITGAASVEHFAPKSRALPDAYEWTNYRLACSRLNARKNNFADVLDPFTMPADTFRLNILDGSIYINSASAPEVLLAAQTTVERLKLDSGEMRKARLQRIDYYFKEGCSSRFLRGESPFIWSEMLRQGLFQASETGR